jgi:hypothetical protein
MHNDYDLKQEQLNKSSLMSSKKFLEGLLEIFYRHVVSPFANSTFLWSIFPSNKTRIRIEAKELGSVGDRGHA